MNKKGTEKPIEIFVALFIILAVALVMLKLFQSQIAEKQKELADVQQAQQAKELRDKVELACREKCTQASNNGCSFASLASLCVFGSKNVLGPDQFIDLNNNKKKDYDTSLLAGVGVCEERVYCFHLMDSCCAREVSAKECKNILKTYWERKGIVQAGNPLDLKEKLDSLVPPLNLPSTCEPDELIWSNLTALGGWGTR